MGAPKRSNDRVSRFDRKGETLLESVIVDGNKDTVKESALDTPDKIVFPIVLDLLYEEDNKATVAGTDQSEFCVWGLKISAKWMQYGPLLGIMGADFNFLKGMFQYTPDTYGEYVDPVHHEIYVIADEPFLDLVYPHGVNKNALLLDLVSYDARRNSTTGDCLSTVPSCLTDQKTSSKYFSSIWDHAGLVVGLLLLTGFLGVVNAAKSEAIEEEIEFRRDLSKQTKVRVSAKESLLPLVL